MRREAHGIIFVWVGVVLLLGLVTGCDTVSQDMEIRPVSLGEIHGQTGHLIRMVGSGNNLPTAAFRADKWGGGTVPIFFITQYYPEENLGKDIEFLLQASRMSLSFEKPNGIPILSTIRIGAVSGPTVTAYLIASVNTYPLYLRIITERSVYETHLNAFRAMVSKTPKVIHLPGFPKQPTVSEEEARRIANGLLNCFGSDLLKVQTKAQREHFVNFDSDFKKLLEKHGFTNEMVGAFWLFYRKESPHEDIEDSRSNMGWFLAVAREFFYFEALYPEKTKEEVVEMCNQLIRDGTIKFSGPIEIPHSDIACD